MALNEYLYCKETGHLEVLKAEIPQVPERGVIIKVSYCGICHSDAHIYSNKEHSIFLPRVMGHEISGTIHEIGKHCERVDFATDDRVVVFPFGGCRHCNACKVDNQNCTHNNGPNVHGYGFWKEGGFQHYIAVEDSWSVVHIPADISRDLASIVTCGGITAYNAVETCKDSITEAIRVNGEANMLIMGVGGLGLWAVDIARAMYGPTVKICAVDIFQDKLDDAQAAGADLALLQHKEGDPKDKADQIINCFNGQKVDASIDFVNSPATMERIYHTLNLGSTAAMVGICSGKLPSLDLLHITTKNIRLQGVYAGRKAHVTKLFNLILNAKVKGPAISHVALEDVKDVLDKMSRGQLNRGRSVVKFT